MMHAMTRLPVTNLLYARACRAARCQRTSSTIPRPTQPETPTMPTTNDLPSLDVFVPSEPSPEVPQPDLVPGALAHIAHARERAPQRFQRHATCRSQSCRTQRGHPTWCRSAKWSQRLRPRRFHSSLKSHHQAPTNHKLCVLYNRCNTSFVQHTQC